MSTTAKGQYHPFAHARGLTVMSVLFQGANGADPIASLTEDPGRAIGTVTRTAEGVYKVPLKRRYAMVHAIAGVDGGADDDAQVSACVDGGAVDNYVEVTCQTGAGTNDDVDAKNVTVIIFAYDSTGSQG
jgi:hypothetical protein